MSTLFENLSVIRTKSHLYVFTALSSLVVILTADLIDVATNVFLRPDYIWPSLIQTTITAAIIAVPFITMAACANYALFLAKAEFQMLARTDLQTSLLNRRGFFEEAERRIADGAKTTLLIIDIDRFKRINDRFGHLVGDQVIAAVGDELNDRMPHAICGRVGGEEFAVLLPTASENSAMQQAEDLRWHIVTGLAVRALVRAPVTVSIGLCVLDGQTMLEAYGMADKALYRAKKAGRNRCVIALRGSASPEGADSFVAVRLATQMAS